MSDLSVTAVQATPAAIVSNSGGTGGDTSSQSQLLNVQDQVFLSPEGRALMERMQAEQAMQAQSEGDGTDPITDEDREKPKKTKEPFPKDTPGE